MCVCECRHLHERKRCLYSHLTTFLANFFFFLTLFGGFRVWSRDHLPRPPVTHPKKNRVEHSRPVTLLHLIPTRFQTESILRSLYKEGRCTVSPHSYVCCCLCPATQFFTSVPPHPPPPVADSVFLFSLWCHFCVAVKDHSANQRQLPVFVGEHLLFIHKDNFIFSLFFFFFFFSFSPSDFLSPSSSSNAETRENKFSRNLFRPPTPNERLKTIGCEAI